MSRKTLVIRAAAYCGFYFLILPALHSQCLTAGPQNGSVFSNDISTGSFAFSSPSSAQTSDNNRAAASAIVSLFTGNTNYLKASGFGFTIPPATTICGVMVEVEKSATGISILATVNDNVVQLIKGGIITGNNYASSSNWTGTDTYSTYGGPSDLWGGTWTTADINSASFGVAFSAKIDGLVTLLPTARVDHIRVTVYYNYVIVPVTLTRFSGNANPLGEAVLSWSLTGNVDQSLVRLQKQTSYDSWTTIYTSTSKLSPTAQSFEYTDNSFDRTGADYRLEITSPNGMSTFSSIVHIEPPIDNRVIVYPDPATDLIRINCTENIHSLDCIDIDGRIYRLSFQKYGNLYHADISRLKSGIYFLKLNNTISRVVKR